MKHKNKTLKTLAITILIAFIVFFVIYEFYSTHPTQSYTKPIETYPVDLSSTQYVPPIINGHGTGALPHGHVVSVYIYTTFPHGNGVQSNALHGINYQISPMLGDTPELTPEQYQIGQNIRLVRTYEDGFTEQCTSLTLNTTMVKIVGIASDTLSPSETPTYTYAIQIPNNIWS